MKFETTDGGIEDDPVVVDYGPKRLRSSLGADEKREWHLTATLAAGLPTPIDVLPMPGISASTSRSWEEHHAASVEASDFPSRDHTRPDGVRFWLRENDKQRGGLPIDFYCAAIVKYTTAFQASVHVKAGPVFDIFARPWTITDPILFEPGVEFGLEENGPSVDGGSKDFAALSPGQWRKLVTPDLDLAMNVVHDS